VRRAAVRAAIAGALVVAAGAGVVMATTLGGAEQASTTAWKPLRRATLERTEVAAARIGRFIYVAGGFERRSGATTAAVERYDIRHDAWRRVRSMPIALNHAVAVAYRGRLYVHGGYRARRSLSSASAFLLRYDPSRNRWVRLRSSRTPRAAHAAAVVGGGLYVAGGANAHGSLRSLEAYDFRTRRWRRGPSFAGPARNHATGAAFGRFFYVIAGRDRGNLRAVDRYDTRSHGWRRVQPLRFARGGIVAARLRDGRIAVFGGEQLGAGGTTIRQVELLDPRSGRWGRLPDMRTPRHGLGGAALGYRVYALEGGPQPGFHFSNLTEVLDVRPR
jgi:N-acetylneuraminic acid mutarotase